MKQFAFIVAAFLFSTSSFAQQHIAVGVGVGSLDNENTDPNLGQFFIEYNYLLSLPWSFQVRYLVGDSDDFNLVLDDILTENDLEMNSLILALRADHKLSNQFSLYATMGANFYEYKTRYRQRNIRDESGGGFAGAIGGQYQLNQNWSLGAEYQYLDFGDANSNTFNLKLGYHF